MGNTKTRTTTKRKIIIVFLILILVLIVALVITAIYIINTRMLFSDSDAMLDFLTGTWRYYRESSIVAQKIIINGESFKYYKDDEFTLGGVIICRPMLGTFGVKITESSSPNEENMENLPLHEFVVRHKPSVMISKPNLEYGHYYKQ
jgi:hypothetical protein